MDKQTIDAYNQEAENIAQLHATLTPHRIYELINHYFIKEGCTHNYFPQLHTWQIQPPYHPARFHVVACDE